MLVLILIMMGAYLMSIILAFIARYESKEGLAASSTYDLSGLVIMPNLLFDIITYGSDQNSIWFILGDAGLTLIMFMLGLHERSKKPAIDLKARDEAIIAECANYAREIFLRQNITIWKTRTEYAYNMVLSAVPQIRAMREISKANESLDEQYKITEDIDKIVNLMSRWQRAYYKIRKKYKSVTEQHQKLITDTAEAIGNKIRDLYEQITEHYILVKTETDTSKTAQLIGEMNELKKQAKQLEEAYKSMLTKYKATEELYYIEPKKRS